MAESEGHTHLFRVKKVADAAADPLAHSVNSHATAIKFVNEYEN